MKRVVKAPGACCNVLIFLLLALPVTCAPAWAATYTVTKDGRGSNDKITGAGRFTTLTALVNNGVKSGDTVKVGPGVYILSETLELRAGVKLIGAGADRTILTGNNILTIIECTAPVATTDNTLLSGFTVTGSKANNDDGYHDGGLGGGMHINGASPAVTNCTFSGNQAGNGGGMVIGEANPEVTNCTFSGNEADYGGGMVIEEGNPKVTNCTFAGNKAIDGYGGGMEISGGSPAVTNCTFEGNSAADGSAIFIDNNSTVTLKNCVVDGVEANKSGSVKRGN